MIMRLKTTPLSRMTFVMQSRSNFQRVLSQTVLLPNEWVHVAGVLGPTKMELFVNGALEGAVGVNAMVPRAPVLIIGRTASRKVCRHFMPECLPLLRQCSALLTNVAVCGAVGNCARVRRRRRGQRSRRGAAQAERFWRCSDAGRRACKLVRRRSTVGTWILECNDGQWVGVEAGRAA